MEQLFNDMRQHLATRLGSRLAQITEDCGQLDAVENGTAEQYPLSFPCVLISMPEVEWSALKTDEPRGRATLTVKVAFECATEEAGKVQPVATQGSMATEDGGSDSEGTARAQGEPGKAAAEEGGSDSEGTARTQGEPGKAVAEEGGSDSEGTARAQGEPGKAAAEDGGSDSEGTARTQGEPGKTAAEEGGSDSEGTAITERLKLAAEVNASLNGWIFEGCGRPLRRTHSHQYSRRGEIKVYEVTYATVVQE